MKNKNIAALSLLAASIVSAPAFAVDCTGVEAWVNGQVYTTGNMAIVDNNAYQANWWTNNANPVQNSGPWQVWTDLGDCGGIVLTTPPVATISGIPTTATEGDTIVVEVSATDADGPITSLVLNLDGTQVASSTNGSLVFNWTATQGAHEFTTTAIDSDSEQGTAAANIQVEGLVTGNILPVASITAAATAKEGDIISINASATDADGTISMIEVLLDNVVIDTAAGEAITTTWTAVKGNHVLSARATDNLDGVDEAEQSIAVSTVVEPNTDFKIVGYMPSWSGNVNDIQYDKLTHINYSFILPNADGSLGGLEGPTKLQNLVTNAHAAGVKVGIAVGGWNGGNDSAFETLAANPTTRTAFVNNLMNFVEQYNLDGVDMDWEYPDPGASGDRYSLLMNELATALHAKGHFLSAAVVGHGYTGGGVQDSVFNDVDFLNLMAYDENNGDHSNYQYAITSLDYWLGRGLPKEKAVLGVPFYARPSWSSFGNIIAADASLACKDTDGTNYYNGVPTIRAKTELAMERAGGIMNWELSQDSKSTASLLTAKWEVANGLAPSYNCGDVIIDPPKSTACVDLNIDSTSYPTYPSWPAGDHANGGQRINHNAKVYEAKWWTNSTPGSDETWKAICDI